MQGCKSCRIYGRLMSVQGCLNLVLACRIVRPPEAFPDRWSLVERLIVDVIMSLQEAKLVKDREEDDEGTRGC
jgi:hypothetical protein